MEIFNWKGIFILLYLMIMLGGCTTIPTIPTIPSYDVSVNSISCEETINGKNYILFSGMKNVTVDDLQFIEYANYVKRALVTHGFTMVDKINDADIAVFLNYGISDPKEHRFTFSMPIWGQTGVKSSTTYGNSNVYGNVYSSGSSTSLSATGTSSKTTTYTPSYGILGATTQQGSFVTYTRYIEINAYDVKSFWESKKEKQLWKTEIISTGHSGDLRMVFPVLIAASSPYIGQNTGRRVEINIKENNKEVLYIKGIIEDKQK